MQSQDFNTVWFYWTRNQYAHFIVFRDPDNRVATGTIKEIKFASGDCHSEFEWEVIGPCWSTHEYHGTAKTLDEAKLAVNERVNRITNEEFREEYIPPLG